MGSSICIGLPLNDCMGATDMVIQASIERYNFIIASLRLKRHYLCYRIEDMEPNDHHHIKDNQVISITNAPHSQLAQSSKLKVN